MRASVLAALPAVLLADAAPAPARADQVGVYFIRAGEVWRADAAGRGAAAVTTTGGTVDRFEVSRDGRYLAYEAIAGYVDDAGEWDGEAPPKRAVTHIRVADLATGRAVASVRPKDEPFVHILRWLGNGSLVYYTAGFFDVGAHVALDPSTGATRDVDYAVAAQSDQTADGRVRVLLGEGLALRVLEPARGGARPLLAGRGVPSPVLSPDGAAVAAVQVDWHATPRLDRLLVVDVAGGNAREVVADPVRPKSGPGVAWSPDGRFVSMLWPPEALVVRADGAPETHRVRGQGFAWLDGGTLLVERGKDAVAYRLAARAASPFLANAANVRVAAR